MRLYKNYLLQRIFTPWFIIIFSLLTTLRVFAQHQASVAAINYHIKLANESFHGMLVIHRLLENFNQEVNKYVDLQSSQINFYGNADLPANVFQDSANWFYDPSPYEWFKKCERNSTLVPSEIRRDLWSFRQQLKSVIDSLNQLRFDIEQTLVNRNLKLVANQKYIYTQLESGVRLYNQAFKLRQFLQNKLNEWSKNKPEVNTTDWRYLQITSQLLLEHMRTNRRDEVTKQHDLLVQWLRTKSFPAALKGVKTSADQLVKYSGFYLEEKPVDPFYLLYGDYYYYLNIELLNRYNRYGNGLVSEMNVYLEQQPSKLLWLEEPPLYKVVYPSHPEINPYQAGKDSIIQIAPHTLKDRKIIRQQEAIHVDEVQLTLRVFDHMEQDGDIVSINFNGIWVLDNYPLTRKPKNIYVRMNPQGHNYIILHAINVGSRPPNTVAIEYTYRGEVKRIILNSDLHQSEMVELSLTQAK